MRACIGLLLFQMVSVAEAQTKKSKVLKSELLRVSRFLPGMVFQIVSVDDFLLIKHKQEDTYLTLVDVKDPQGNILHTGIIGPDVGELYNPGSVMAEKRNFSVLNDRSLITFYLDSILHDQKYVPKSAQPDWTDRPVINVVNVGEFYYVSNEVTKPLRFSLLDEFGQILWEFGEFPKQDTVLKDNPEHVNNVAYQSELTSNPELHRIAAATRYGEYLAFAEIDLAEERAEIIQEHDRELPLFEVDMTYGEPNFGIGQETKAGYLSLTSDENFVFALFSGKKIAQGDQDVFISDVIQVFNWDGEQVATLKLDRKLSSITLNNGKLYGVYKSGDTYDIAKFKLDSEMMF